MKVEVTEADGTVWILHATKVAVITSGGRSDFWESEGLARERKLKEDAVAMCERRTRERDEALKHVKAAQDDARTLGDGTTDGTPGAGLEPAEGL